uniref:Secreted protein n=1 Tax=Anopheles melas TaxID=34690 RepID=A0A182UKF0_9DIPT
MLTTTHCHIFAVSLGRNWVLLLLLLRLFPLPHARNAECSQVLPVILAELPGYKRHRIVGGLCLRRRLLVSLWAGELLSLRYLHHFQLAADSIAFSFASCARSTGAAATTALIASCCCRCRLLSSRKCFSRVYRVYSSYLSG